MEYNNRIFTPYINGRTGNYWNRTTTGKIIVGWVVYFFETQCISIGEYIRQEQWLNLRLRLMKDYLATGVWQLRTCYHSRDAVRPNRLFTVLILDGRLGNCRCLFCFNA